MPKMGIKPARVEEHRPSLGLAGALFTGTQQRVLGLLFGQPDRSFYATELIGLAGIGSGAVQRELARLANCGLVDVRYVGNQKHYQANPQAPIYDELCGIARKTFGLAQPLREALEPLAERIAAAFVYGSVAKQTDTARSDIDLMVISDSVEYGDLFLALQAATEKLGRELNPTILTRKELARRITDRESFITRVMEQPKVWLIGGDHALSA